MENTIIVKSKLKEHTELNVAGDVAERLNTLASEIIKAGEERAKANNRKTLQAKDL